MPGYGRQMRENGANDAYAARSVFGLAMAVFQPFFARFAARCAVSGQVQA
jgi:hypothetical protein